MPENDIVEDTFDGLTSKELATSAVIGIGLTIAVIAAYKGAKFLVRKIKAIKEADDHIWSEMTD